MKRIPKPVFFIVVLLIAAFAFTAFFGIKYYEGDIEKPVIKGLSDIRWGIDIRGGVEATFVPVVDETADTEAAKEDSTVDETDPDGGPTNEQLDSARSIIEVRMVANGITDYEIYVDYTNDRIIVRFPWRADESDFDPATAVKELAATAKLTFRAPDGTVVMDGSAVKKATAGADTSQGSSAEPMVYLDLNDEGAQIFAEVTQTYLNQQISIYMDDTLLSSPTVQSVITGGKATISGNFDWDSANKLATQINGGALPFALEAPTYSGISPTLGQNSLTAMGYAAIIAFAIIAVLMIIRYRVPGFIAVIALLGQMALSIAAVSGFFTVFNSFTMTLPGIAGLILSVGMGVDANIITAERIKEEFKTGKTIDSAIERGSKSSLSAIIDGNMTVVIVSIILLLVFGPSNILSMIFGESTTGTIYAFGYTLLMGVISNFIMGVLLSRVMLKSVAGIKFLRKKWLFGGAGK